MAIITYNPYPLLGSQLTAGLDSIATTLTPASTVDDLVNAIYNYVQPLYYPSTSGTPSTQIEIEIKSVIYNIINAYNDKVIAKLPWTEQQSNFIFMMLGRVTTNNTPINALGTWLTDIQDNISSSGQTIDQQTPLLLGIECGITLYNYWVSKVTTPGSWAPFFQTPSGLNYANIPLWTAAGTQATLIGANASQKGLIAPTTDITSVNIVSALIGALAVGAGKVIFKWTPEILPRDLVINFNGKLVGGFSDAIGNGNEHNPLGKKKPPFNNCGFIGCINESCGTSDTNSKKCLTTTPK